MDTTNLRVTFTAPASGIVIVKWHGYINAGANVGYIGVLDGATLKKFGTASNGSYQTVDPAGNGLLKITGLTGGTSYTYDLAWKISAGTYTAYGNGADEQNTVMVVLAG
jgi:hypothetical protein